MVVTANPLATAAGAKMLQNGGSAVDAMIAAQLVLGLVEPQSSGIGRWCLRRLLRCGDRHDHDPMTPEKRPRRAPPATGSSTTKVTRSDSSTPGKADCRSAYLAFPRLLEMLHDRHGTLPWPRLFTPGITTAQAGFELTERTASQAAALLSQKCPRRASCVLSATRPPLSTSLIRTGNPQGSRHADAQQALRGHFEAAPQRRRRRLLQRPERGGHRCRGHRRPEHRGAT